MTAVEQDAPCPAWCCGDADQCYLEGDKTHQSAPIDTWVPVGDTTKPITVYVAGMRNGEGLDCDPDTVRAEGSTAPGFMGGVDLRVADARRLAQALLRGCEMIEAAQTD